jgi:hypothetical protein
MKLKTYLLMITAGVFLISCDPSNPPNPNEQEVVTSLQITCTSPTDTTVFGYSDPDGNGGNPPTITTAYFTVSNVYSVNLELLDETKTPVDTITQEILAEATEHQFFFTPLGANMSSSYGDLDDNGYPVGLVNSFTTFNGSTGTMKVTLRHQPNKSASGVSSGDITNAGGETDMEVTFPVVIQ